MGSELLGLMGIDPDDPEVVAALEDARAAERLVDTLVTQRQRLGLSQADVAERMHTTQSAVSKFERAGGDPRLSTLQRYARSVEARLRWAVDASPRVSADWRAGQSTSLPVVTTEDDGYEEPFTLPVRMSA
ncbi:helix-turn-helix transcriptional regulator [Micromonospora echinospora]|uniref:helix-turn-helix domain-containing protein n=1 Tax=Micromonospora echinospora TaxID=1877 RepID=UPI0033E9B674